MWKSDYDVSSDPEDFKRLMAYSPLQNLKPGVAYPPTLVTTGDHDDRVVPAHSFKFIATLQADQAGPAPVLIRIETKGGHGAGKPTGKSARRARRPVGLPREEPAHDRSLRWPGSLRLRPGTPWGGDESHKVLHLYLIVEMVLFVFALAEGVGSR